MPLPIQSRFFLTRQCANIIEELHRRLKQAGSISLLYGVKAVGKSRLIEHFVETRLSSTDTLFVRFNSNGSFIFVSKANEEYPPDNFIDQIIDRLNNNATLLIDQFEFAPVLIKQKTFELWANKALEKELKLVISVQHSELKQLTEISQRFHLPIDCVELKPLNYEEQLEYLSAYACPGLRQSTELSSELKKLLKSTKGLFSQLEIFQHQYENEINCKEITLAARWALSRKIIYGLFAALILTLSFIGFQHYMVTNELTTIFAATVDETTSSQIVPDDVVESLPSQTEIPSSELPEEVVDVVSNVSAVSSGQTMNNLDSPDETENMDEKFIPAASSAVVEEPQNNNTDGLINETFFQQRLEATKNWLATADEKSASIQIMTMVNSENKQQSLNRYLKHLKSKNLNLEHIMIFPLTKGNRQIIGVLYGTFDNLNMAYKQIKQLPVELQANQPIPRTVKGINDEIRGN